MENITTETFVTLVQALPGGRGGEGEQIDGVSILRLVKRGFYIYIFLSLHNLNNHKYLYLYLPLLNSVAKKYS